MTVCHKPSSTGSPKFHYAWIIVLVGTLSVFACLGLARFAFGMLLPSMRDALAMSYDQMGYLGTANFAGYLFSVAVTPLLLRRLSPRALITVGLLLISTCMLGISGSTSYPSVLLLYSLVGVGSGLTNIPIMVLVSYWLRRDRRGQAAGLIVAGSGFAIIFSGVLVPYLNAGFTENGWRIGWLVLGILVFFVSLVAGFLVRNDPAEMALEPCGTIQAVDYDPSSSKGDFDGLRVLMHLGALYFVFGATYVVYGTFIVTTMVEEYAYAEASAGMFWSWVGFFSLFSGIIFGPLSDKIGRKGGLMAVFGVQALAYFLAGSRLGTIAVFVSVVLYGVAVFAIPAIMAAAVGDYFGKAKAATAFSVITFCFAFGQTIGPTLAGLVAQASGTFMPSYLAAGALAAIAALVAARLPSLSANY
ncbi:MAG: YbfB/YjiJ family MFS transporter [Deltaproteobacteria bacterium]|jgi:MFS family permease|nr:YbfB/YjiJ family MFS transporter [Deltaproteobacteria bacterium]